MQNAPFHSFMWLYILYDLIIIIDAYTWRVHVNVVGLFNLLHWSFCKIFFIYKDNLIL